MRAGVLLFRVVALLAGPAAHADQYDAPAGYYASATGTGATLKAQLYTITKTGFKYINYGDARYALGELWQDPNNADNLLNIYSGRSVTGTWDSGVTWNREHIATENSLGISVTNTYKGYGSDLFDLAPTISGDNSNRSNLGYGYTGSSSTPSQTTFGRVTGTDGNTYWYAGDAWRGDTARSLFYMATRYYTGQGTSGIDSGNNYNLTLANGTPNTSGQMGDLNTLLHWAYQDGVDTFERRKNALTYSGLVVSGVNYSQGNRNPYIDHPEYIWSVFGTKANTSTITVGTPATNGASSATVNLGRVIVGSAFATSTVTLNKTGDTPTSFDVVAAGGATGSLVGTGQVFDYNSASRNMTVGLATAATAGLLNGTVTIDNTDLTTAAAGQGAADGNDVVNISGVAVDHSNASFFTSSDNNHFTISFGVLQQGSSGQQSFSISNLTSTAGYTASLDLDAITGTGNTASLFTNIALFSNLLAGNSVSFLASFDTSKLGSFSAQYTLRTSDENITGATAGTNLVLDLSGSVVAVPEPATLVFVGAGLGLLACRRRRP